MSQKAKEPARVALVLDLHPIDHQAMQDAAQLAGMAPADFCRLAIHRFTSELDDVRGIYNNPKDRTCTP